MTFGGQNLTDLPSSSSRPSERGWVRITARIGRMVCFARDRGANCPACSYKVNGNMVELSLAIKKGQSWKWPLSVARGAILAGLLKEALATRRSEEPCCHAAGVKSNSPARCSRRHGREVIKIAG